jgi:hypothetical protein
MCILLAFGSGDRERGRGRGRERERDRDRDGGRDGGRGRDRGRDQGRQQDNDQPGEGEAVEVRRGDRCTSLHKSPRREALSHPSISESPLFAS